MRTRVCSVPGFVPRHCAHSPENSAMQFDVIFTYVIVFIFLVNTYVLSNCYVHSTVLASLEITARSLPSLWEVLMNRGGRLCDGTSQWDPVRLWEFWRGRSPHRPGAWSLITGAPLLACPGRGPRLGLAAQLLSPPQCHLRKIDPPQPIVCPQHRGNPRLLPPTAPSPPSVDAKEANPSLGCW